MTVVGRPKALLGSLTWPGVPRAMTLMLLLAALMCLDVWLSAGTLAGREVYLLEGNPIARALGLNWMLVIKLVLAGALGAYYLWRRSTKPLVVACWTMAAVTVWNVIMLGVFS